MKKAFKVIAIITVIAILTAFINYVPVEASGYSVRFIVNNIGEVKPPVSEECLRQMGFPIQNYDYFNNNKSSATIKPESYIEFNWDKSSLEQQYVTSVAVYEYSTEHITSYRSYYSTDIPSALSFSTMVLHDETGIVEIDLDYSVPQSDGSTKTGFVGTYYTVQKDPYNVTFKNLDSNGNIIPAHEGIGWYSASYGQALYRLYNPNATGAGSHHYTTTATERDWLISLGWIYEGIGWYGI